MDELIIEQSLGLKGNIRISGAKNAALPILFAALLFDKKLSLYEVPELRDIYTTLELLETLGCSTHFENNTVHIEPHEIGNTAPYDLVKTMRASVLCLGPLLARSCYAKVAMPGGCAIGSRPVDLHLSALEKMGAEFELSEGYIIGRCNGKLKGANIHFDFPTVGGTENIIMAACLAEGTTVLENVAREPEIVDLVKFLRSAGAKISGEGSSIITIEGVSSLNSTSYSIMPDRIEAGTFLIAAGMTDGDIRLENCCLADMEATVEKLTQMGLSISEENGLVRVKKVQEIKCADISTRPHPGFPTDMQAQFMTLMSIANGASLVEETIFENRFMHVQELVRMGADIKITGSSAMVRGVPMLSGAPVMASDLRASASLVLAALAAKGTTTVSRIYHLDRGYERMEVKLSALGAKIKRVHIPKSNG